LRRPSFRAATLLAVAAVCAACSTILGIEPLDAGPGDDGGGSDGSLAESSGSSGSSSGGSTADGAKADASGDAGKDGGDATLPDGSSSEGAAAEGSTLDGSGATDGSSFDVAPYDGPHVSSDASVSIVAAAGSVSYPTGNAQQVHVIFPVHDGRAWYFYVDDDVTQIKTRISSDLVTWAPGPTIVLPVTQGFEGYGSNIDVAYADIGGADVVHVIASLDSYAVTHFRTRIVGGTFTTPSTTVDVNGSSCQVDGPGTLVTANGHVFDVTGLDNSHGTYCDMDLYSSSIVDDGGAGWNATFAQTGYYVTVPGTTSAHQLVPLAANEVLGAYANGEETVYEPISWAKTTGGLWPDAGAASVFGALPGNYNGCGYDDWAICRQSDGEYHAVRHLTTTADHADAFDHAIYDGGVAWSTGQIVPPVQQSPFNQGVVLVSDTNPAHGLLLAVLGIDEVTIWVTVWDPVAVNWGGWQALATDGASKSSLAGSGCGTPYPMLFWSEGDPDGGQVVIHGLSVGSLL
jgi:hypothetical protein